MSIFEYFYIVLQYNHIIFNLYIFIFIQRQDTNVKINYEAVSFIVIIVLNYA